MSTSAMNASLCWCSSRNTTRSYSSQTCYKTFDSSNSPLTHGARLSYREVLEARQQRPSVRDENERGPEIYPGIWYTNATPSDGQPQHVAGLPQVYLQRRENAFQAYGLLPEKKISLSHHHPEWGDVYFAVICPLNGNSFSPPPKKSAKFAAIKRLKKSAVDECLRLGRHENPYKEIARLQELGDNIHVLKIIEALEDDEYLYIVTPKGIGTLADIIPWHSRQFLDPERVRLIFQQMLQILLYLESHNIVHRDMSPDNFLFLNPDNLVVFDFGFSLRVPVNKATGRRYLMDNEGNFGTPPYMCPELYVDAPYDSLSSDLWSVTAILLNLLTNGWLCDRPHHADICFRYLVLAQGLSSSHDNNDRAEEILRSVFGSGTDRSPRNLIWQIQALQHLDDSAIELLANVLHINPAVRWSLAQAIQSDFLNNNGEHQSSVVDTLKAFRSIPPVEMAPQHSTISEKNNNLKQTTSNEIGKYEENVEQSALLMSLKEQQWDLTWPHWHLIHHDEQKAMALTYGFETIGEFEEFISEQRALVVSARTTTTMKPPSSPSKSDSQEVA